MKKLTNEETSRLLPRYQRVFGSPFSLHDASLKQIVIRFNDESLDMTWLLDCVTEDNEVIPYSIRFSNVVGELPLFKAFDHYFSDSEILFDDAQRVFTFVFQASPEFLSREFQCGAISEPVDVALIL